MDKRITLPISKIIIESEDVRTFYFEYNLQARPGQFIMLTDFENGEKPFSICECTGEYFAITVKRLGQFTSALFGKEVGDFMSIRGAYGSSFFLSDRKVLLVGGGYGTPPLYFLTKELLRKGANVTIANGAKTKENLLFCERFKKLSVTYQKITQAGCFGKKGTSVDVAKDLIQNNHYDFVYAAGPDLMMKALVPILKEFEYEFLFERYMKCAIGICGQCTLDPIGIRVCVEGPVLPKKLVLQISEFGEYHRDATGKRIPF